MAENKATKFKELFGDFFQKALFSPIILETQAIKLKLILQRLYFLDKKDELKEALQFLQDLELVSGKFYSNISSLIDEIETTFPKIISDYRIHSITSNIHRRIGSAGKNIKQVKDLL